MDVNLSSKKKGIRTGGILRPGDEGQIRDALLTQRELMSQIHRIYDPLGLLSPTTIKFKLVLQKLVEAKLGWDVPLEGELRSAAESAVMEIVWSGSISFLRCVLGKCYVNQGRILMGFWDGGRPAASMPAHHSRRWVPMVKLTLSDCLLGKLE